MRTAIITTLFIGMLSCQKEEKALPQLYLDLRINGKRHDFIWEEMDGMWDGGNGSAYINCVSDQYEQFSLYLPGVNHTGILSDIGMHNISYSDAIGFRSSGISNAMVEVKQKTAHQIAGSFQAGLICEGSVDEEVQIAGDFVIITPH